MVCCELLYLIRFVTYLHLTESGEVFDWELGWTFYNLCDLYTSMDVMHSDLHLILGSYDRTVRKVCKKYVTMYYMDVIRRGIDFLYKKLYLESRLPQIL